MALDFNLLHTFDSDEVVPTKALGMLSSLLFVGSSLDGSVPSSTPHRLTLPGLSDTVLISGTPWDDTGDPEYVFSGPDGYAYFILGPIRQVRRVSSAGVGSLWCDWSGLNRRYGYGGAFSDDGRCWITAPNNNGLIEISAAGTYTTIHSFGANAGGIVHDNGVLYTASYSGFIRTWDIGTSTATNLISHGLFGVEDLTIADGRLYILDRDDGGVRSYLLDGTDMQVESDGSYTGLSDTLGITYSPHDGRIYVQATNGPLFYAQLSIVATPAPVTWGAGWT